MNNIFTFVFCLLAGYLNIQAQIVIEDKAFWPTTEDLGAVNFYDNMTGWIAGANGVILKTTDGGDTWNEFNSGIAVSYSADKILITDNSNILVRSVISVYPPEFQWSVSGDGGESWRSLNAPAPQIISDIHVFDADNWIAVGRDQLIITTSDRGLSWNTVNYSPGTFIDYKEVFFLDQNTGWYSTTEFNLYKTTNRGTNWTVLSSEYYGHNMKFFNSVTGYSNDFSVVYKTTNGGATWSSIIEDFYLVACYPEDENNIFVSTGLNENGSGFPVILFSTDGGTNWDSTSYVDKNFQIRGLCGIDNKIFITGQKGYAAVSADKMNFKPLLGDYMTGIYAFEDKAITVGYSGELYWIKDEGDTWEKIEAEISGGPNHIIFTDELTGFIIGEHIWRSLDGGTSWALINFPAENHMPFHAFWLDKNKILYLKKDTPDFKIYRTPDDGDSWIEINTPVNPFEFFPLDTLCMWVKDDDDFIYKTTDGGNNWTSLNTLPTRFGFFSADSGVGFIEENIYKTTTGGLSWEPMPSNTGMIHYNIFHEKYYDYNFAYLLLRDFYLPGDETIHPFELWLYKDGIFQQLQSYTAKILSSISFFNKSSGWIAAGRNVFRVVDQSVTAAESEPSRVPEDYILEQNYPNPFNPTTTIKFSIPANGNVSLKIYDVLGRQIMTLTDKEYNRGTHSIKFDASDISSGIYLYKLTAGNFISVRKFQVLK